MRTILTLILVLLSAPIHAAAQTNPYLQELVAAARAHHLADNETWHALLHYQPRIFHSGFDSLADGPGFFFAPDGKYNPEAELEATLAAFFAPEPLEAGRQHPQCAFIARFHWLDDQLHFDPARLPLHACPEFEHWYHSINPGQATLIFPSAYLNNPSSMYGHTLLRLDPPAGEGDAFSAYAINYAADTDETNGLVFAIKGLTGGYPGYYSVMPYYEKVKEYNDLENRDIWEYRLSLTQPELRRLLEHAWELRNTWFQYFFFDENCSYELLSLLDVARPGMNLTAQFRAWAIPTDTVAAVVAEPGMLTGVTYRPSNLSGIRYRLSQLSPHERDLVKSLAEGKDTDLKSLPPDQQAVVYETTYDYIQYQYAIGDRNRAQTAPLSYRLLTARSKLGKQPVPTVPTPATRPDQGHGSARAGLRVGREAGHDYVEITARPAYHDLLDPEPGYVPGAQIAFFDLAVRYDKKIESTRLQQLDFLDIYSMTPRDEFLHPLSWHIRAGLSRPLVAGVTERPLVGDVAGGVGWAYALGDSATWLVSAESRLLGSDRLPDGYGVGAGPGLTALWNPIGPLRIRLDARVLRYGAGLLTTEQTGELQASWQLDQKTALRIGYRRQNIDSQHLQSAELGLYRYF